MVVVELVSSHLLHHNPRYRRQTTGVLLLCCMLVSDYSSSLGNRETIYSVPGVDGVSSSLAAVLHVSDLGQASTGDTEHLQPFVRPNEPLNKLARIGRTYGCHNGVWDESFEWDTHCVFSW